MKQPQFTISPQGVIVINQNGVVVQDALREPKFADYQEKPVKVSLSHDLTLQLHGAKFVANKKLSVDEALGLMNLLAYVVREQVALGRK